MPIKKMVMNTQPFFYKEKKICILTNYRTGSTFLNLRMCDLNNSIKMGEHFTYTGVREDLSKFESVFAEIHQNKSFVLKLMADHLQYNDDAIYKVLNSVDKIIYLYRRDFSAQAKSYIAARITKTFNINGFKEEFEPTSVINVPENYHEHTNSWVELLKKNYITMSKFYKEMPGDLFCLEDFKVQRPYKKTIIWPGPEPVIEPFDVESLFVKSYEMA